MTRADAIAVRLVVAGVFLPWSYGTAQPERYRTRPSDCRYEAPPGTPLALQTTDTRITSDGYTAQRVLTYAGDASHLSGGELVACSEYGRVELVDSDDDRVRVQVRWDAFGEGADDPAAAARRAIEETDVRVFVTAHDGRLFVRVWHSTLGFTPGGQPAWVGIRVQVPARGAYRVAAEAFHGVLSLRRLTLAGVTLRGRVGEKLKGIDGFHLGTELFDVTLSGDVDISTPMTEHGAPVIARVRVAAPSRITVLTGGDIDIAVQPHPTLGVKAFAASQSGSARVAIDRGVPGVPRPNEYPSQAQGETPEFHAFPLRADVHAVSGQGKVEVASIPNAPLRPGVPDRR